MRQTVLKTDGRYYQRSPLFVPNGSNPFIFPPILPTAPTNLWTIPEKLITNYAFNFRLVKTWNDTLTKYEKTTKVLL